MSAEPLDVAIIGAGTAGLSARAEVAQVTDSYRVFDPGPYGTFCARAACMPSKALLHSAHAFHRRHTFQALGILGGDALKVDAERVMSETRKLRDSLVAGVEESMEPWRDTHLVTHAAILEPDGILRAGGTRFRPRATVIATGSRAVVPGGWRDRLGDRLLTSDDIFELHDLPQRLAVIGLGPVGLELGQALARLGVEVTGFDPAATIGGLTDPSLLDRLSRSLSDEMTIVNSVAEPIETDEGAIRVEWDGGATEVDMILVAMGRRPNIKSLGLDTWNAAPDEDGHPDLPDGQLNLPGTRIYFVGDVGTGPALLHEASDEGRIAGYFAARDRDARFDRRTPLRMVFCEPQIALVGATWEELQDRVGEIAIGEASFDQAGRMRLQRAPGGMLRIYAEKATAHILGAAIVAPEAEHLAHLLALAIERRDDLRTLLRMPVYHPTHEEVLRRGLREALRATTVDASELDAIRCEDAPVDCNAD